MNFVFEKTDTFGGEANYAWAKRSDIQFMDDNVSDLKLVRRAKKWAGWSGERCRVVYFGQTIGIYPRHRCEVLFIYMSY